MTTPQPITPPDWVPASWHEPTNALTLRRAHIDAMTDEQFVAYVDLLITAHQIGRRAKHIEWWLLLPVLCATLAFGLTVIAFLSEPLADEHVFGMTHAWLTVWDDLTAAFYILTFVTGSLWFGIGKWLDHLGGAQCARASDAMEAADRAAYDEEYDDDDEEDDHPLSRLYLVENNSN